MTQLIGNIIALLLLIALVAGLVFFAMYQWSTTEVCTRQVRIKSLIQAVGHKVTTDYIYELEGGGRWKVEGILYQDGQQVCMETTRV